MPCKEESGSQGALEKPRKGRLPARSRRAVESMGLLQSLLEEGSESLGWRRLVFLSPQLCFLRFGDTLNTGLEVALGWRISEDRGLTL